MLKFRAPDSVCTQIPVLVIVYPDLDTALRVLLILLVALLATIVL
jgi:hypothetical protein